MKSIFWLGLFTFGVSGLAHAQAKNPKYVYDQEKGVILFRPSGEEWSCKKPEEGDDVFFRDTVAMVYHRLEDVGVQVCVNEKEQNQSFPSLKEAASNQLKAYQTNSNKQPIQGRKVVTKLNVPRKFPGAGGPKAQYLECEIDDSGRNGPKTTLRQYFFIKKKNANHLVIITITGNAESYKKHQRKVLWILAKMRTEKVKKR